MSCDYCITPHESVKEMHSFLTSMGFKHTFLRGLKGRELSVTLVNREDAVPSVLMVLAE